MTRTRTVFRRSFALAALLLTVVIPTGLPAQAVQTVAHVRLWKTELRGLTGLRVSFKPTSGRHPASRDLVGGGAGYVFENYADVPAGRGTLEVYVATDKHPLMSLAVDFSPGGFFTVFLREPEPPGDKPHLEIIEDSAATGDAAAQFIVRNFVENFKDVRVTMGESVNAQFPAGKGFMQMQGIRPAVYPVYTSGNGPDGKPFEWSTEADLKQHPHQTLLIYPDPYGRIRPRLIVDGEIQTGPPNGKESQR